MLPENFVAFSNYYNFLVCQIGTRLALETWTFDFFLKFFARGYY